MAGNGISGVNGNFLIGSTAVSETTKWNFGPKSNNPKYCSNKTAPYTWRVPGVKDGSGSADGKWDPTNPLTAVLDVGTLFTGKFYLDAVAYYQVPAVVDDIKLNVDIDTGEIVSWTVTFSTVGAWTNPTSGMMAPRPDGTTVDQTTPNAPMAPQEAMTPEKVAAVVAQQLAGAEERIAALAAQMAVTAMANVLREQRQPQETPRANAA
jgi:hypothetical protein